MSGDEPKEVHSGDESAPQDNKDHTLNEFLSDVTLAARELTTNIRSSVNKVLEQSVRVVNPSGNDPRLDMYETKENVFIETTPLENADPEAIEITMLGDQLTIRLRTSDERGIDEESFLLREKGYGEFTRSLEIPRAVKIEEARAVLRQGKLLITLPKPRLTRAKQIHIIAED